MIKTLSGPFERLLNAYTEHRARQEAERLSEMQYAREMRNRSEFGTPQYYYYNSIVRTNGGR
ncbi:MAG: hypothetical protein KI785_01100 [Devosiaceae bacterium]|nr:hypothetical protein [Devosiaceae bacterium MH13]